jgi:hypothetical protein
MHGVLYFIMKELMVMYDPLCKEYDLIVYLKSCKDTFDTEIRSYDVLTVASFENVLALVMGVGNISLHKSTCFQLLNYKNIRF